MYSLIKLETEGKIDANVLMRHLADVQLADERNEYVKSHEIFGDVKVLIETTLVKQGYNFVLNLYLNLVILQF